MIVLYELLRYIFSIGVIHSDLKPANFVLVAGQLKLIDFGIARSIQVDRTSVTINDMTGTLNYMSPESMQQQKVVLTNETVLALYTVRKPNYHLYKKLFYVIFPQK